MTDAQHPFCRCLFYSASALARATTRLAEQAFAPAGLAPSAAYVLMLVLREPGAGPGRIAELMMLDASTVTRLLERLEGRGLVKRTARGRAVSVQATAAGRALRRTLAACAREVQAGLGQALGHGLGPLTAEVFGAARAMQGGRGRR